MRILRNKMAAVSFVVAAAVPTLVGVETASAAPSAATTYSYRVVGTGGIGVCRRVSPNLSAARDGCIAEGAKVTVNCWVTGGAVTDYWQGRLITWNRWARTPDSRYVADIYLSSTSTSYPRCTSTPNPTTRETRAVAWARTQLGVSYTTLTPDGKWSGWCELFVEKAFGTSGRYGSAAANYRAQLAAGRIHTTGTPPVGAMLFYAWGTFGHSALSIGGGQAISTQGFASALPVRQHSVTGLGLPYLGWAYAPSSWPGR